jgi:alkanesulfonate monooxygenase SsuD/methylene tetrahydromethanopterin reductase-like flavin-dependent oxidoreductase (luciferase family)
VHVTSATGAGAGTTTLGLALKDPPMAAVARIAVAAEDAGLTHLLTTELSIVEEPATGRDPFLVSSVALAATQRLIAGTGVVGSVFHAPRHLALTAATLQEQSGGRFVLGVGVAHKVFADHIGWPYPSSPLTHAREHVSELVRYSRSGLAFGGGFPVWLAGLGDRMVETAATHADGVLLNWVSPETVRASLDRLAELGAPRPTVAVFVRVASADVLLAGARRYAEMFANYRRHFERQGLTDPATTVARTCGDIDRTDALLRLVQEYESAGADHVLLYPADVDMATTERFVHAIGHGRAH